jgi:hypothetical protein
MRMLMTLLMCDIVLGAAMALYLVVAWRKCKGAIAENGLNTRPVVTRALELKGSVLS